MIQWLAFNLGFRVNICKMKARKHNILGNTHICHIGELDEKIETEIEIQPASSGLHLQQWFYTSGTKQTTGYKMCISRLKFIVK